MSRKFYYYSSKHYGRELHIFVELTWFIFGHSVFSSGIAVVIHSVVNTSRVTTHLEDLENLEKSGNSKVVRENEKSRETEISFIVQLNYQILIHLSCCCHLMCHSAAVTA